MAWRLLGLAQNARPAGPLDIHGTPAQHPARWPATSTRRGVAVEGEGGRATEVPSRY